MALHIERVDLTPRWRRAPASIVLHHGLGTCADAWGDWLPLLAPSRPVIRSDLRGFGRSGPLPALPPAQLLDVLIDDLLRVCGSQPVHVVGESAGGTIALAAARRHPGRFASVTIINAAYAGRAIGQIGGWRKLLVEEGVRGWSERMMGWRFAKGSLDDRARAWFASVQEKSEPTAILAIADMLAATDLSADITRFEPPLLILAPDQSPFVSLETARELHAAVRDSELLVFDGVRHGLPFSHATACARAVLDFVKRRTATAMPRARARQ